MAETPKLVSLMRKAQLDLIFVRGYDDGVEFTETWANRMSTKFDDQPASVLSRDDLIRNKRAAGRIHDLADLERLEAQGKKS